MGGRRRGRARSNGSLLYLSECRVCRRPALATDTHGRKCTRGCVRGPGGRAGAWLRHGMRAATPPS
eukprot:4576965-Prymnesium_polylepis.1